MVLNFKKANFSVTKFRNVDTNNILIFNKVSFDPKDCKYFIGYKDDDRKLIHYA